MGEIMIFNYFSMDYKDPKKSYGNLETLNSTVAITMDEIGT